MVAAYRDGGWSADAIAEAWPTLADAGPVGRHPAPRATDAMNVDDLVAIDMHVHAEISADGHLSLPEHLMAGSAAVLQDRRRPHARPSTEIAAYYRQRRMAAVVFTVDAETATGHPPISSEEVAEACAAARRRADPVRQRRPVARRPARSARPGRWRASTAYAGFKFHPSLQAFHPNDRMAYPLYEALQELGMIALFHSGQTGIGAGLPGGGGIRLKYANPMALDDVAADFPDLRIVIAHPSFPWQDEALAVATHKPQRLHRPVRLVAEVLPAAARPVRQHAAARQGPVRVGLPAAHPGPVAGRLRHPRHQAGGAPADPQGQRRPAARPAGGRDA